MDAFWPGPPAWCTAPARSDVSRAVTAGQEQHGPGYRPPLARQLLGHRQQAGGALGQPRYMSISPTSTAHVMQQFADSDLLILDGGPCAVGLESTIVGLLPGEPARLLREGMLSAGQIEAVLGEPLARGEAGEHRVPGQHHRHYRAWHADPALPAGAVQRSAGPALRLALVWGRATERGTCTLNVGDNPERYAQGLYAALYELDNLGLDRLLIRRRRQARPGPRCSDRLARASRPLD